MTHRIALNFEDGVTRFVDAQPGESVADAAYRQGINVPLDCRDGACGTCKAFCQSGVFDRGSYIEDALSDEDAARGYVLCCQTRPKSDLTLDILASSLACKVKPSDVTAEVLAVEALSEHRVRLSLKAAEGSLSAFLPGQYVNIDVPGHPVTRSYSFSSAPGAEVATFLIRNIPGGRMSSYLEGAARAGDRLTLKGPFGSFYLRPPKRPVLMLAGGTGIAPILSMMEELAATGTDGQPVRLLYGVHDDVDLVEVERIDALAARIPGFSYATCCSAPSSKHPLTGYVTDHFGADALHGGDVDIYLCGPPEMVEAVRRHVAALGTSRANLHFEKFVPAKEGLDS